MIPQANAIKLIKIYFLICEHWDVDLKYLCDRFSNNNQPELTDQEVMTIYLYVMDQEKRLSVKDIYQFADRYLRSWFPCLGSYEAFNKQVKPIVRSLPKACLHTFRAETAWGLYFGSKSSGFDAHYHLFRQTHG